MGLIKSKNISVRRLVVFTTGLLVSLCITALSLVVTAITQTEKDKLWSLSTQVTRAVSNDLLFNDEISLNYTLRKLRLVHNLEKIIVSSQPISCPITTLSCITLEIESIEPKRFLVIIGNSSVSEIVIWSFLFLITSSMMLFSGIVYVLVMKIKTPLEHISSCMIPQLFEHVETGKPIETKEVHGVFEIEVIILNLSKMTERLRRSLEQNKAIERRLSVNEAIARTTQALAHDVRKPFTMFKMLIDLIEGTSDPEVSQKLLKRAMPEVQKAMARVNGMIADVMEVGAESKLSCEPTQPECLLETSIIEIFRVLPNSDVNIFYELNHTHLVNVDTLKVNRVLSNIICNAVQAMNGNGKIWIRTHDVESEAFVLFCIGNADSFISEDILPKLFDAFFTSKKKGGTGLGLAIAQKIVQAHGGKIWYESIKDDEHPRGKVEFFFTLPSDKSRSSSCFRALPENSREIARFLDQIRIQAGLLGRESVEKELKLEATLAEKLKRFTEPLPILFVDDEAVYLNALASLISRSAELSKRILVRCASDAVEGMRLAETEQPLLIILDVDLGKDCANGLETVKRMRERGFAGRVCIHSNRFLADDYRVALEAGADTVVPKPLSRELFLKIVLEALDQRLARAMAPSEASKPEIAFIGDKEFSRLDWELKLSSDAKIYSFDGALSFWRKVDEDQSLLSRLECVITDFEFVPGETESIEQLVAKLKTRGFAKPILLATDREFEEEDVRRIVNKVIAKSALSWKELNSIVESLEQLPE